MADNVSLIDMVSAKAVASLMEDLVIVLDDMVSAMAVEVASLMEDLVIVLDDMVSAMAVEVASLMD